MTERSSLLPKPATVQNPNDAVEEGFNLVSYSIWSNVSKYMYMLVAGISFATSSFFVHVVEKSYGISSEETFFIVFLVSWLSLFPYILCMSRPLAIFNIQKNQILFIALRATLGTVSAFLFFTAMKLAPIGDVAASYNVCPTVTLLLAFIFLKEKIRKIDIISLCLSTVGVYLITRSPVVDGYISQNYSIGIICGALSGIFAASTYIAIRYLKRNIHFITPAFFFFPTGTLFGILIGGVPTGAEFISHGYGSILMVLAGIFAGAAQVFINLGLQNCPAGPAIIIRNLEVPLEYILGLIFLGETPTLMTLFAALLIMSSTIMTSIRKSR